MRVVYRYIDKKDGLIKYIGIVTSDKRTLSQRVKEHMSDSWYNNGDWSIEYFTEDLDTKGECEAWEGHLIAKYKTYEWYNKAKSNWGLNKNLPEEPEWKVHVCDESSVSINNKKCFSVKFGNDAFPFIINALTRTELKLIIGIIPLVSKQDNVLRDCDGKNCNVFYIAEYLSENYDNVRKAITGLKKKGLLWTGVYNGMKSMVVNPNLYTKNYIIPKEISELFKSSILSS